MKKKVFTELEKTNNSLWRNRFYNGFVICMLIIFSLLNIQIKADIKMQDEKHDTTGYGTATFGAGCFWCTEAIFMRLKGVIKVEPGYSGGSTQDPTYKEVCTGNTGHAEVCQIIYDPKVISYSKLLEVFWSVHDPTTLNRQGNDVGTQYRSVVFYRNELQKTQAEEMKAKLEKEHLWDDPIVTQIVPFVKFYPAESYHDEYFDKNPNQPYCTYVIAPKLKKFEKLYKDNLKQ